MKRKAEAMRKAEEWQAAAENFRARERQTALTLGLPDSEEEEVVDEREESSSDRNGRSAMPTIDSVLWKGSKSSE